jgi:hypothetical protein
MLFFLALAYQQGKDVVSGFSIDYSSLRASPTVLSMGLHTVKFIVKKSKCAGLAQEIGFSAPDWYSLPWLVKGATQLWTSTKECNKLDLTTS